MKPKLMKVLEQCLEVGMARGWDKAHKHTDEPSEEMIKNEMLFAIEHEMYEWFDFEGED